MITSSCIRSGIAILAISASVAAAEVSKAAPCVAPGANRTITWRGVSAAGARLFFRSENAKTEHYVEMRRGGVGRFVGVLPKPDAAAAINYRVATPLPDGSYATRAAGTVAVKTDCAAPESSPSDAALVVGSTTEGPAVPVGFSCDGIIGRITPQGELSAYDACAALAVAAGGTTRSTYGNRDAADAPKRGQTSTSTKPPGTETLGVGVITPDHHRRPRRAPIPPTAPNPRVVEPVSPSRP